MTKETVTTLIGFDWERVATPPTCRPSAKCYRMGNLSVIVDQEPEGWHMSIAHTIRYPTWDEIKNARYRFCPDEIVMAQILPPKSEWVNIHNNCFHLWEIKQ